MKFRLFVGAVLAALVANIALAEDGIPSQARLNGLGLSSLIVAKDADGDTVRGHGFVKTVFSWHTAAGEKATVNYSDVTGLNVLIDPLAFIANDTNSGAGIASDGIPLIGAPATPQAITIFADSAHQQTVVTNNFTFSEISASNTSAQVFAGTVPFGFVP